jgi:molybdopterin-guanine dinucleotide biosynthesis protein A
LNDLYDYSSSLVGIYSGLSYCLDPYAFIIGCDMPFIKKGVVEKIMTNVGSEDMVIPIINGIHQPLCAVYRKSCIKILKNQIERMDFSIYNFIKKMNVKYLFANNFFEFDKELSSFINVNTKNDLLRNNLWENHETENSSYCGNEKRRENLSY